MACLKDYCPYPDKKCESSRAGCIYFELACEYDDDPCERIKSIRSIGECRGCDRKPKPSPIAVPVRGQPGLWAMTDSEGKTEYVSIESRIVSTVWTGEAAERVINGESEMALLATAFRNAFGWMRNLPTSTSARFRGIDLE